jgi:hypothetical protein
MDSFGVLSLQSGFVVAVIIAAVLLVDRLGGYEDLARKACQVALGIVITLTVFAGTASLIRLPDLPESAGIFDVGTSESQDEQEELEQFIKDSAKKSSEAGTIHLGIGIALIAVGGLALLRLRVIPASLILGGILLVLLGAAPSEGGTRNDALSLLYAPFLGYATDPGQAHDAARFIVLLVGTVVLLGFISWRWEVPPPAESPTTLPPGPATPQEPTGEMPANGF